MTAKGMMGALERDCQRFKFFADEPRPAIPDGYTAPLDTRFTRQLISERRAKSPQDEVGR